MPQAALLMSILRSCGILNATFPLDMASKTVYFTRGTKVITKMKVQGMHACSL